MVEASNRPDQNNDDIVVESSIELGNIFFDQGDFTEALKYYYKALAIEPNYISVLHNKGVALHELGNYTEAIKYYDRALTIDPKFTYSLNNKGNAIFSGSMKRSIM